MFRRYSLVDTSPSISRLSVLTKNLQQRTPAPDIVVDHVPISEVTPPQRKSRSLHSSPVYRKKDSSPNGLKFTQKEIPLKNSIYTGAGNLTEARRFSRVTHQQNHGSSLSNHLTVQPIHECLLMRKRDQFVSGRK